MQRQEGEIPRQINYDLWERIRCQILQYPHRVVVRKTKGHATAYHILRGKSTIFEKHGNDQADLLAEQGAAVNSPPQELLVAMQNHRKQIVALQEMMLAIYQARESAPELKNALERHAQETRFARRAQIARR